MNIPFLLSPKVNTSYIDFDSTVRQGLEKFKVHGFTAVPVIDDNGFYMGTVTEGDFLRYVLSVERFTLRDTEDVYIRDIMTHDKNPPLNIEAGLDELTARLMNSNFVPIVDGRGYYIGIVTRKSLLGYMSGKFDLLSK